MSQPEISRVLRIPQQTVAYRIDAVMKLSRNLLPKAEFSVLPVAELLREAMVSGSAALSPASRALARLMLSPPR